MTTAEITAHLQSKATPKVAAIYQRNHAGPNALGVMAGDIKALAKKLKTNHPLALELWATGLLEARMLAVLVADPKQLTNELLDEWVQADPSWHLADWFNNYIMKDYADRETLRQHWMQASHPMAQRAGWSLTAGAVVRKPETLDLPALLDRIEAEMPTAHPAAQWTMNTTLAQIGINHPQLRGRALEIGHRLGVYKDYPVSKGCTSPFAPIWIGEMVRRAEAAV